MANAWRAVAPVVSPAAAVALATEKYRRKTNVFQIENRIAKYCTAKVVLQGSSDNKNYCNDLVIRSHVFLVGHLSRIVLLQLLFCFCCSFVSN